MLNTIKAPPREFNLLNLNYLEMLLASSKAYMFNLNNSESSPFYNFLMENSNKTVLSEKFNEYLNKPILKGKLHLSAAHIIFQPDEFSLPLVKLKYFDNSIELINLLDITELDSTNNNIDLKNTNQLNNLLKNNNFESTNFKNIDHLNHHNVKNKKPIQPSQTMNRYEEAAPLHIEITNFSDSLEKIILKGKQNFSKSNNNNNFDGYNNPTNNDRNMKLLNKKSVFNPNSNNLSHEYKIVQKYFTDKEIDCKPLFDTLTNYLLVSANKDQNYNSFCFLQLTTDSYQTISRNTFTDYKKQRSTSDSFLFIVENKKKELNDFKNLVNYMKEGLLNENFDTNLIDDFINIVILNKMKEMKIEEKRSLFNKDNVEYMNNNNNNTSKMNNTKTKENYSFVEEVFSKKKTQKQENAAFKANNNLFSNSNAINTIRIGQDDLDEIGNYNYQYYLFRYKVNRILPEGIQTGLFVIKDKEEVVFWPITNNFKNKVLSFKLNQIKSILNYRCTHQHRGLKLILFKSKRDKLFEFESSEDRDNVYNYLKENCNNLSSYYSNNVKEVMNMWVDNLISNYDYLLYLNNMASRSFSDLTQYPIFPWIFNDYSSNTIDLSNNSVYRDLTKPIGCLSKCFPEAKKKFEESKSLNDFAYFYGMHYSNSQIVNHMLIRSFPQFVQNYEGGSFGVSERIFNSVNELWEFIMNNSGDFRELTPEFYSGEGDFLISFNDIEIDGKYLKSVVLPNWAKSPSDFISIMKNGLESEYVNENLHNWIDLIFGYKQTGEEAEKAYNLFHPYCYEESTQSKNILDVSDL